MNESLATQKVTNQHGVTFTKGDLLYFPFENENMFLIIRDFYRKEKETYLIGDCIAKQRSGKALEFLDISEKEMVDMDRIPYSLKISRKGIENVKFSSIYKKSKTPSLKKDFARMHEQIDITEKVLDYAESKGLIPSKGQ